MKIALVNMPFYSSSWASIQLGLLKAILEQQGFGVDDHYLNLSFAKQVGWDLYDRASLTSDLLFGDWAFSQAAFGEGFGGEAYLLRNETALRASGVFAQAVQIRDQVPQWLDQVFAETNWGQYDAIGFSCTFMQTVASIALAQKIKSKWPSVKILFGGSAVEDSMGREISLKAPCVDCVIQGEGERALPEILHAIAAGKPIPKLHRSQVSTQLSDLPVPSYESFYRQAESEPSLGVSIPLEASRGCWWGQKHHCKFCGLNGSTLTYRSKEPDQVLKEIEALSRQYHRYSYQVVDNILDHRYFKTILPKLIQSGTSYSFFFEVKSNLSLTQIESLALAGVKSIQPGIESLSTPVLKLMDKGVSAQQNIHTLKWCRYFGIGVEWNLLFGFPGETENDYEGMIALIPKLHHLTPPGGAYRLRMDRFSPYFNNRLNGDFEDVRPSGNYNLIYPSYFDFEKLAYFFESKGKTQVTEDTYQRFQKAARDWQEKWRAKDAPQLKLLNGLESGHVVDTRGEEPKTHQLFGAHYTVAKALDEKPLPFPTLLQTTGLDQATLEACLADLTAEGLTVSLDGTFVWLAVCDRLKRLN